MDMTELTEEWSQSWSLSEQSLDLALSMAIALPGGHLLLQHLPGAQGKPEISYRRGDVWGEELLARKPESGTSCCIGYSLMVGPTLPTCRIICALIGRLMSWIQILQQLC